MILNHSLKWRLLIINWELIIWIGHILRRIKHHLILIHHLLMMLRKLMILRMLRNLKMLRILSIRYLMV
jgi:hypothetical protein